MILDHYFKFSNPGTIGINVVALVITIVIIIILAGVTINAIVGDNGLIYQAKNSKDAASNEIASKEGSMNDMLAEYANVMAEDKEIPISGPQETPEPPIEKSEVEQAKDSGETFEDTTAIKDDLDNEVKIPGGFHIAEDSGTKVEEGIVIEDDIGNQFVWVPVGEYNVSTTINSSGKLTNNLSRRTFTESGATEVNGDDVINTYYYGEDNSNSVAKEQIGAFKTSANSNHGFYIGRYEAGTEVKRTSKDDALTTPLIQANKNAYIYISRDNAKRQAEAMYSGNSYVVSELISSYAWDTALNFICQTNEEGYTLAITTDSTYGNIGTYTKELTGAYETDKYSNIHDILGNCYEYTTEFCSYSFGPCVIRGGYYYNSSIYAANRGGITDSANYSYYSFRLQLYVN